VLLYLRAGTEESNRKLLTMMQECQLFDCEFRCILLLAILGQKLRVCAGLHRPEVSTKRDQGFSSGWSTTKNWAWEEGVEVQTDRQTDKTYPIFILSMRVWQDRVTISAVAKA